MEPRLDPENFARLLCSPALGSHLGRVGSKFISNMLVGIHRTRSVNLTKVAKGLNEDIRLHATHKRLSRNLDDIDLTYKISDALLKLGAKSVKADTRLIVHVHQLKKKYACKIEYLSNTRVDADSCFSVCEILASGPESDTYIPLLASVWSDQVPDYKSDAEEVIKALRKVLKATDNKGMVYLDDRSIPDEMLQLIILEPNLKFTVLLRNREMRVLHGREETSVAAVATKAETQYGKIVFKLTPESASVPSMSDLDLFMHVGASSVRLPDTSRRLSLIAMKINNRLVGQDSIPVITTETNLRSRKALMGLVDSYLSMHDIVQAHRKLRDSFEPSGFRVLTYHRLQLLMTLLQAVIHYETAVRDGIAIESHQFSHTPHETALHRTYYRPDSVGSGISCKEQGGAQTVLMNA